MEGLFYVSSKKQETGLFCLCVRVKVEVFLKINHYQNLPMQYTKIFFSSKIENFHQKKFDIFLIFAQNIDCGYKLEPPRRGGSNEYPQSMFWSKNKKNRYTPAYPSIAI